MTQRVRDLAQGEDGFAGGLIVGLILGAILVIWLLFKLIGAIF